jgi:hypothetical protein
MGLCATSFHIQELFIVPMSISNDKKFRGFSPPANYADRATAACRRS